MKKLYFTKLLFLTGVIVPSLTFGTHNAEAKGSMEILGVPYSVDTIAHFKVGPGTTTTYLRLKNEAGSKLQVHYLTIDKSQPGVSIRAVCGKDMVAGTERVSDMAKRHSSGNTLYFAGSNADFFTTSGNATNGSSKVGSPTTSCTVDGEIFKTSNSQYQFSVDRDGVARIGRLNYYTGTAKLGEKTTLFKGVNVASPSNGITIYTPKYWGSTNQTDNAGSSFEVTAKLVQGDEFKAGGKFRLEVTSEPSDAGDTKIPDDGFVIHGRGTSTTNCNTAALSFVGGLKPGDIVEFDNIVLFGDTRIYPQQIVSGNPKNVGEGKTLDTEGERGDASALHPRTGIGVSQDGNTIIMMVVEGRHNGSVGVRTSQLADIMRYAGAYEAVNLDGGGSSTLYTSAFGVRNYCSDGHERAVGNGIFAVVEARADEKEIAEIRFSDWAPRLPKYGNYVPRIIGYNKYGVVVNDSITDYTLEVKPGEGEIVDNGISYYATELGMYALKAKYKNLETSVAVDVNNECLFTTKFTSLFIDGKRSYEIELFGNNGIRNIPVKASILDWSSNDVSVATVSEDGIVRGVSNGTAIITGTIAERTIELPVTVEIMKEKQTNILAGNGIEDWKFTKSGCAAAGTLYTSSAESFAVDFKTSTSRSPSVTVTADPAVRIWSIPEDITFEVNSTSDLEYIILKIKDAKGDPYNYKTDKISANDPKTYSVNLNELINTKDISLYPLSFVSVNFYLPKKSGAEGHIEVPSIMAVYGDGAGVDDIISDSDSSSDARKEYFNLQGIKIEKPAAGLYIERQGSKVEKKIIK